MTKTLLTTSLKPTAESRRLLKFISHILVDSKKISRGRMNEYEIYLQADSFNATKIIFIHHDKSKDKYKITILQLKNKKFVDVYPQLELSEVIDNKIYGWQSLPAKPPISTGNLFAETYPGITSYFQEHFDLKIDVKTQIWVVGNQSSKGFYVQFIDQVTLRPFFSARIRLIHKNRK
jgi:rRNA maturation protein Rpf1